MPEQFYAERALLGFDGLSSSTPPGDARCYALRAFDSSPVLPAGTSRHSTWRSKAKTPSEPGEDKNGLRSSPKGREAQSTAGGTGLPKETGCITGLGCFEVWHRRSSKQPLTGLSKPTGPTSGTRDASAVRGDSRICVHLPVDFGNQDKGEAGAE